jgi:hypothetical protein
MDAYATPAPPSDFATGFGCKQTGHLFGPKLSRLLHALVSKLSLDDPRVVDPKLL